MLPALHHTTPRAPRLLSRTALWLAVLGSAGAAHALDASQTVRVTPVLKATSSWDDKQITYPDGRGEVTGLVIEIAPGAETGWHEHPIPSFAYILQGELQVTRQDGQVKRLKTGDALAEVVSVIHNGRAVSAEPVKLVVFYTGAFGKVLTIARPEFTLSVSALQEAVKNGEAR
ncbi:MAG: cupin domain-containing protein [Leptothrix sp. (in: b-proteobacteria)]